MEKIAILESYIQTTESKQKNEFEDSSIIVVLNELSKLNPTCLSENGYKQLMKNLPLSPDTYSDRVLAAVCNLIASLCSYDLVRNYFGEQMTVATVNILKLLSNRTVKEQCFQALLLQTCRAIGNLCYYHEENTKCALKEDCLLITFGFLRTDPEENCRPVLIGLLLNLTHLDNHNYQVLVKDKNNNSYRVLTCFQFPDNMVEEINSFGIQCVKSNDNNYKSYVNLVSLMINIVRKSSSNNNITDYEKCSVIDSLLEHYYSYIDIASICVKFIKKVSKTCNVYSWILKGKHKILVQTLDYYEENPEEDANHIVNKICDIITLLSDDDGSMDNDKNLEVLFLVDWLLLKVESKNLYIKLSAVRSLGNFSRFKYVSNNITVNPAKTVIKHMPWFINTLDKSIKDKNSLMVISILCLFKNMLYVTSFESMNDDDKDKLIKTTIEVLTNTKVIPIVIKALEIIGLIIKKGGMNKKQLGLYKDSTFIELITAHSNNANEEISVLANKLLVSINENIHVSEIDVLHLVDKSLQIKD